MYFMTFSKTGTWMVMVNEEGDKERDIAIVRQMKREKQREAVRDRVRQRDKERQKI